MDPCGNPISTRDPCDFTPFTCTYHIISLYYASLRAIKCFYFIIIIYSLQQSTAGHRPLPKRATSAARIQLLPATFRRSSLHLAGERPTLRLPKRGLHCRTRLLHRLSVLRQICPLHSPLPLQLTYSSGYVGMAVTLFPTYIK